ncbi:protein trunk-like [Watersipora subatra]|uniref:protein trunk-like n=1 Tax=Watersipora subatra TaxID=2589382 RepID=UPI00355C8389
MLHCRTYGILACCLYLSVTVSVFSGTLSGSSDEPPQKSEPVKNRPSQMYSTTVPVENIMMADASLNASVLIGSDESDKEKHRRRKDRNKKKDRVSRKEGCEERSEVDLKDLLGPAFNGRYMSVDKPVEVEEETANTEADAATGERMADGSGATAVRVVPFHVEADFRRDLPHDFYLDISWYQEVVHTLSDNAAKLLRLARNVVGEANTLPWKCEAEIVWTDLGSNYYPRFLRNVQCTRDNCWFGHFKCRPKAFTVNVLKRARDSCKDSETGQEWIFEERAVTFCCECVEH